MTTRLVIQASTVYFAVTFLEMASALISVPIMTRLLSPAEYGMILLIANTSAIASLLFGYSLAQALPSLFTASPDEGHRRATATTILWAIFFVSGIVHCCIVLTATQLSQLKILAFQTSPPIALAGFASFAMTTSLSLANLVRLRERSSLVAWVQIPATLLQLGLLLYLLVSAQWGLSSLYLAMSVVGAITTVVYIYALRRDLTGHFDWHILQDAARIAVRMLPWQLATLLATNTGGFLLARSGHLEEAGMFAIAAGLVAVMVGLSNSFVGAWTPFVLNRHTDPGLVATQRNVFRLFSSGLMLAASGLALFAQEIFSILVGPAFRQAYHFVPPLVFAYSLFCFAQAFSQGLQAKQEMRAYAGVGTAVATVFLAVSFTLVSRFGAYGLIAAMGAAFLTMLVLLQRVSERLLPVGYPWWRHGLMWLAAIGIVSMTYGTGISWQGFASKAAAVMAIAILAFILGGFGASDLRNLWSMRPGSRS
jgi:O-antigen/teichoic acid export membrane protein